MCAELWREEERRARLQHRCELCEGIIASGQHYIHASGFQDGRPFTYKAHKTCLRAMQSFIRESGEDCWGEEWFPEIEEYAAIMATPEHLR